MVVPLQRLQALKQVQCRIFNTVYNPLGLRTGNKVLRQRLKGQLLADWYPRKLLTIQHIRSAFPEFEEVYDEDQEDRLEHLTILNARGKGAPKKKRTAAESKKFKGKKH